MSVTVVGLKCFKSKKGSDCSVIFFNEDFSDYELNSSSFIEGNKCGEQVLLGSCNDLKLGDEIEFVYRRGINGQAIVDGYKIL